MACHVVLVSTADFAISRCTGSHPMNPNDSLGSFEQWHFVHPLVQFSPRRYKEVAFMWVSRHLIFSNSGRSNTYVHQVAHHLLAAMWLLLLLMLSQLPVIYVLKCRHHLKDTIIPWVSLCWKVQHEEFAITWLRIGHTRLTYSQLLLPLRSSVSCLHLDVSQDPPITLGGWWTRYSWTRADTCLIFCQVLVLKVSSLILQYRSSPLGESKNPYLWWEFIPALFSVNHFGIWCLTRQGIRILIGVTVVQIPVAI